MLVVVVLLGLVLIVQWSYVATSTCQELSAHWPRHSRGKTMSYVALSTCQELSAHWPHRNGGKAINTCKYNNLIWHFTVVLWR